MTTHERVLALLETRWIDMGGGRKTLPRKQLPPHAYDPSPCVFIAPNTRNADDDQIAAEFVVQCRTDRRFNWGQVPHLMAWRAIAPSGETFFIFKWGNWDKKTLPLFREFCERTGRLHGLLTVDRMIDLGSRRISFLDCKLVHESEVQSRQSTAETVSPARQDVVATAQKLAKGRKPALQELEIVQFRDDRAAHDDALHNRLRREFAQRLKSLQKEMSMTFGPPDETGTDDHEAIPLNGVFQYAIWRTGNQRLFVAAAHADCELPYLIMLGTTPRARK